MASDAALPPRIGRLSRPMRFGRLVALRALPLFLRPAAVAAEGLLPGDGQVLVVTIPLVALALTMSSIPVHVDYFTSSERQYDHERKGADYCAALTIILICGCLALPAFAGMTALVRDPFILLALPAFFISEKLIDEVSRLIEFRKQFAAWSAIQALRSFWLFVPLAFAYRGMSYEAAFLSVSLAVAAGSLALFVRVYGLRLNLSVRGFGLIRDKAFYLLGASLPALYRQGPRIAVASMFPAFAHIYLVAAQVTQAIALLFDVRFSIPYRKMSARHPRLFHAAWGAKMAVIAGCFLGLACLYLLPVMLAGLPPLDNALLAALLAPLLVVEGLTLSLFTFCAGLMPWFVRQYSASRTYAACLAVHAVLALALASTFAAGDQRLLVAIPAANLLGGLAWRAIVVSRHFGMRG